MKSRFTYAQARRRVKRAQDEYREFVVCKPGKKLDATMRCIEYIVTRMDRCSVISDQMGGILLAHMLEFSELETRRMRGRK